MSYAPETLLEAREVVQAGTGLSDASVGIVGDTDHDGGYHCGWDRRDTTSNGSLDDYSWEESSRDWNHKTDAASALDIGWFDKLLDGRPLTLIDFNLWLVNECAIGAPDTLDIREVIYTPDGNVVKRWDRLGQRSSGDDSHLLHTHISRFRDAENKPFAPLFARFFGGIMTAQESRSTTNTWQTLYDVLSGHPEVTHLQELWSEAPLQLPNVFLKYYQDLDAKLDRVIELLEGLNTTGGAVSGSANVTGGTITFGPIEE